MVSNQTTNHQRYNNLIARLLKHKQPLNYTENMALAWQALAEMQERSYGFNIASLGRSRYRVRIIKWANTDKHTTTTGEYIVNIVDGPAPFAICRAVAEALEYDHAWQ